MLVWVFAVSVLLFLLLRYRYEYWRRRGIPSVEPTLLFGNVKDMLLMTKTEAEVLDELYRERKDDPLLGVYYLWRPVLLVNDPELAKRIMVGGGFDYFVNHPPISSSTGTDRIGKSLFLMRDSEWKEKRSVFSRMFTPRQLKDWYAGVEENCKKVLPLVEAAAASGEDVEMEGLVQRYAINVITQTLFGLSTDTLENANSAFLKHGRMVANPGPGTVLRSMAYLLAPKVAQSLNLQTFEPSTWHFFLQFVTEVVSYREQNDLVSEDLLSLLIKIKNSSTDDELKTGMSVEDITGHVYAFFLAGYDTTSLTTSYCLYELSQDEEVQDRLREEVDSALAASGGVLSYDLVKGMEYMDWVISETLRKYPPAGIIKRECNRRYRDPELDLTVEEGTMLLIPVQSYHHDPQYFPEPGRFLPSRFERLTPQQQSAYFPFGKGPRICIGMKLAELEVKVALATLLSRFLFLASPRNVSPLRFDPRTVFISVRPKDGLWVRVKPRPPPTPKITIDLDET